MQRKIKTVLIAALLAVAAGCQKIGMDDGSDGGSYVVKDPKAGDGFTLYTDKPMYDGVRQATGEESGADFDILDVRREGNNLVVGLKYPAGCGDRAFDVVWDGRILLSYPAQVNLVLRMNENSCDAGEGETEAEVVIDLKAYVGDFASDKNTVFFVLNASDKMVMELKPIGN